MGIIIRNPTNSFVRFSEADSFNHPIYGEIKYCLDIYAEGDYAFQFVLEGATEGEANALLDLDNNTVTVGLVNECGDSYLLVFAEKPTRAKASERQIAYNWSHGFPDFDTVISIGECFRVKITVAGGYTFCSNCFMRIPTDEFSSVIEYGNEENSFGFNYCVGDAVEEDSEHCVDDGPYGGGAYGGAYGGGSTGGVGNCDPTFITFLNVATISFPYTAMYAAKYGDVPSIQVWIYDSNGDLVNAGITVAFDSIPPTVINIDLGGLASGVFRMS